MKMTKTKLRIGGALVFVAALTMAVAGFAQQGGARGFGGGGRHPGGAEHGGPRGGGLLGPLARDLNLTDAQKTQIKTLTDGFEESAKSLREQLFAAGGSPFDGLTDGAFDETAARAAAQARASIHVELDVARARLMSQVYALLTAEQKTKLAELRRQFEQNGRGQRPGFEK
jgi:Spy/CpxP family protein refolding chaperone